MITQRRYEYLPVNHYNNIRHIPASNNIFTSLPEFKYSVMKNTAFGDIFRNSQKSFHNSPRFRTWIIEAIDYSFNFLSILGFFSKCILWHCWLKRMINYLYNSSRKISERCEDSFVNYGIHNPKLCNLMRQITNWDILLYYLFILH